MEEQVDTITNAQRKHFDQCKITSLKLLEEAVAVVTKSAKIYQPCSCQSSLLDMQNKRLSLVQYGERGYAWNLQYSKALNRAIYSHDWDTLLDLLCSSPIWEHYHPSMIYSKDNYIRAAIILLLNHPSSKAQSTLEQFIHLVLACHSDNDKKALIKILTTLPEKLKMRNSYIKSMKMKDWADENSVIE